MNDKTTSAVYQVTQESLPVIAGIPITTDKHGRFNLNAIYHASGAGDHKRPSKWLATTPAQELVEKLESKSPCTGLKKVESRKGRYGGTFAHELLAVSYAGWISPSFQLDVNQTFLDYRTGKQQRQMEEQKALPSPLTPSHQREIQKAIASRVYTLPEPARPAAFKRVYSKLKDRFEVGTYKDIDDSRYPEVLQTIETVTLEGEWLPQEQAHGQLTEGDLLNLKCLCVHAVNIAHHWQDEIGPAVKALNEPLYNRVSEKIHVASRIAGNFSLAIVKTAVSH